MSNGANTFNSVDDVRFLNGNLIATITDGHDMRARLDRAHEAISYLLSQLDRRRNPPPLLDIGGQVPDVPLTDADRKVGSQLQYIGAEVDALLQEVSGERSGFVLVTLPFRKPAVSWTIQNVKTRDAYKALERQAASLKKYANRDSTQVCD